jgi:hypothetical protein
MNVIPNNAIDEHLVYEALRELGFEPKEEKPSIFFGTSQTKIYIINYIDLNHSQIFFMSFTLLKTWKLLKIQGYGGD